MYTIQLVVNMTNSNKIERKLFLQETITKIKKITIHYTQT
jgi:hypothetical protein